MHTIKRERLGLLDRTLIGILLFLVLVLLGVQVAKADSSGTPRAEVARDAS